MKKPILTIILLILAFLSTIYFTACETNKTPDIPTADISSVLDVLDDDVSGLTWYNETTIDLDQNILITGTGASVIDSHIQISKGGNYIISGTLSNGDITVSTNEPVNLTLNNVNITNLSGPAIYIKEASAAYITLSTDTSNFLVDGKNYASDILASTLVSNAPLHIQGKGSLTISGEYHSAIYCQDKLTIDNGSLFISSIDDGISAKKDLSINGGNINISHAFNGMTSDQSISINDGVISISGVTSGLFTKNTTHIKGGTLNISGCTTGILSDADMVIDEGTLNIACNNIALLSKDDMTINNGHLHLDALKKPISTAHTLTINDGIILALSSALDEAGIEYGDSFKILGGTLLATGGSMITPTKDINTQRSLVLDHITAHTLLHIQEGEHSILTFMPTTDYSYLLFSSPLLEAGLSYDIYVGGTTLGGTDFYGLFQDTSYRPGTKQTSLTL